MGNSQPKQDPKEVAKENQRMLRRAIRTVEREQKKLQQQEGKVLKEIKALATKNQHGPAKILSKDLVRMRAQVNQYYTMISQLKSIEMQLSTATINQNMIDALKGANTVMANVNKDMDMSQIKDVMKRFAKESAKMEMQQEMMNDQVDMAMDNGDTEAQADEVYNMILGEIGMNMNNDIKPGDQEIKDNNAIAAVSVFEFLVSCVERRRRSTESPRCIKGTLSARVPLSPVRPHRLMYVA